MPMIVGGGSITGLSTGGLPAGSVNTNSLAAAAVTQAKVASGVSSTGPTFGAYLSSAQSIGYNTSVKINMATEEFDSDSCYDTTLYRFTPNVAGYYHFGGAVFYNGAGGSINFGATTIWKNGSSTKSCYGTMLASGYGFMTHSSILYANGTTDYFEIYAYQIFYNGNMALQTGSTSTFWTGHLVRAA